MKKMKVTLLFPTLFFCTQVFGGWYIEMENRKTDGDVSKELFYIQNNKMKVVGEQTIILDLEKSEIIFMNHESREYYVGNPGKLLTGIQETIQQVLEEQMANMTDEEKEIIREMKDGLDTDGDMWTSTESVHLKIRETGETDRVLNYPVRKYEVWSGGEQVEDLWVSRKVSVKDEIDMEMLIDFYSNLKLPGMENDYAMAGDYVKLMENGFPLKKEVYHSDGAEVSIAKVAEKKKFKVSVFDVPDGYERVDMESLLGEMMEGSIQD